MTDEKLIYRPGDFQGNPASIALNPQMLTDKGYVAFKRLALKKHSRDAMKDYAVRYDRYYVYDRFKRMFDALGLTDDDEIIDFINSLEDYLNVRRNKAEDESPV